MKKVFEKPEDLSDYLFRIVDNGGSSADRYTVIFSDGSYLSLSSNPTHPHGVSLSGESSSRDRIELAVQEWVDEGEAVDLALGDLPQKIVNHILYRNNEGLEEFLESVENKDERFVAACRDDAEANEGLRDQLGEGIYVAQGKFWVKMEGGPDDRGPFDTAREVILASMPDQDSLSGGEYQSSVDIMRMTPDPAVREAVARLEARREEEWKAEMDRRYP